MLHLDFDAVITMCDSAAETCPVFPGKTRVFHRSIDDTPRLAQDAKTEEQAMSHYRRVREEIKAFVAGLPEGLDL
jgi:arsenate reductase